MKIGIIGTGNMGRTLGARWAVAGHDVLFGSRDVAKAEAAATAATASALSGDVDAAAMHGEVVLYTVRGVPPSRVLRDVRALAGKVVIDCNNSDVDPARPGEFLPAPIPSFAEQLAADVPDARVVQAFTTVPRQVLELGRERLAPREISVFMCSDDARAKETVQQLVADLGLVGVDCGELRRSRVVDGVVEFIRFQIVVMGRGPLTSLSLKRVPEETR